MVDMSPEAITLLMFGLLLLAVLLGYPMAYALAGIAMVVSLLFFSAEQTFAVFYGRIFGIVTNYVLLAAPLFIFMGLMLEKTGISDRLFDAIYLWTGGLRGGLAIATVLIGALLAACVGIIGASVIMLGLIALPSMLSHGYNKELACGAVCAGGTLGILIPPSVMLVVYGPTASIGVGKLFMAAFMPGFMLAGLYIVYIGIASFIKPDLAPAVSVEERAVPFAQKFTALVVSMGPPLFLILAVLGTIFFGIAPPTEAAAIGAVAAVLLAVAYGRFSFQAFKDVTYHSLRITCMVMIIAMCAAMFTSTFLGLGCGDVIMNAIVGIPLGRWASFGLVMFIVFILGMFIDWIGIIFIMVPIVTPIGVALGFDTLWFAMMIIVNLQMSFLTPPFAYALFYLRGICKPEWGVDTGHIVRGVIPFVLLIVLGLFLCITFPQIILWLPEQML
ncbi:MAG: TRAP transporter large permease subunit [Dehalococcoidia bacterium]|nr:TRAP transporter large permease subunit [Dehalococcoidia bacterium]